MQPIGGERHITVQTHKPDNQALLAGQKPAALQLPTYTPGGKEATRKAYGDTLTALGSSRPDVVALDAEVSNSTHADECKKAYEDRFFEMFIAEQQMVLAAVGLSVLGKRPFASTFATFFTRASFTTLSAWSSLRFTTAPNKL